jgi:hypothetical protein
MATVVEARENAILTAATDRFEKRLGEAVGGLRQEMTSLGGELRGDMRELRLELRGDLRSEIATTRADLLKWSFLFWVGQVAVVFGLASLLR